MLQFAGTMSRMPLEPLGDQVRKARKAKGWSQAELARRASVSPRTIWNWEHTGPIPEDRVPQLREALGVTFQPYPGMTWPNAPGSWDAFPATSWDELATPPRRDPVAAELNLEGSHRRRQPPLLTRLRRLRLELDSIIAELGEPDDAPTFQQNRTEPK
jgi:transcriptional regulator with XRE-family HTH domain